VKTIDNNENQQRKVLVLMSTYNGQKYIKEQLDSILHQNNVSVKILVRDDGSSDKTIEILEDYQTKHDIEIIKGKNLKPAQSFRQLVQLCEADYDYYGYSDQDDIWHIQKLAAAIEKLEQNKTEIPALWYCGISRKVDGIEMQPSCCRFERATSFETVVKTFSTTNGCTMVFNRQLLFVLKSCSEGKIDMHDSWTHAMCLACGGNVYCDETPYVKYRIHEHQVLGSQKKTIYAALKRFFAAQGLRSKTIQTMLTSEYIREMERKYLEEICRYKTSFRIKMKLIAEKTSAMSKKEHIEFAVKIITNKF
jgi:rhamnosyltransferase